MIDQGKGNTALVGFALAHVAKNLWSISNVAIDQDAVVFAALENVVCFFCTMADLQVDVHGIECPANRSLYFCICAEEESLKGHREYLR